MIDMVRDSWDPHMYAGRGREWMEHWGLVEERWVLTHQVEP